MSIVEEIIRLKKEKNAIILVHNYQRPEIQNIADSLGDSLGLARKAAKTDAQIIIFCGVRFMAETAKILSPEKMVLLPRKEAGCPMADMITAEDLRILKEKYPGAKVVSYVNTNADVKAESDICCTSANAIEVVRNIRAERVIFTPDRNLAAYCQRFVDKEIIPWNGYCYVHEKIRKDEVRLAKEKFPDALLLVHPECNPSVIDLADEVLSTSGMLNFAEKSDKKKFLIGTEEGLIYRLKKENPGKEFYSAGTAKMCRNMKLTTLNDVYSSLKEERYAIELSEGIIKSAQKALMEMLKYA
ncbi:quinolinate synthase NadA [Candidatus Atribacteria bacterium MT.SAG.1]|nr:quinolinate synthase NadA [Candidatus Atribacteria bacterium MT.SAG.1]